MSRKIPGIEIRHEQGCPARVGKRCAARRPIAPRRTARLSRGGSTRPSATSARRRRGAQTAVRHGALIAGAAPTLREAAAAWLAGARNGSVRNRSGDEYKPSVIAATSRR